MQEGTVQWPRALLFVNANSRQGAELRDAAVAGLGARGLVVLVKERGGRDELSPAIVRHACEADLVVVGRGDGTLDAATPGLVETGLPLGILPLSRPGRRLRALQA